MIQYIEGDIFSSPAQVIVNTVNTVGVMGKGVALSFKKRSIEIALLLSYTDLEGQNGKNCFLKHKVR